MKHAILVPTDFSANAWTALAYAAFLAQKFDFNLHILHVYQSFGSFIINPDFQNHVDQHNSNSAEEQLEELSQKIKAIHPLLSITAACMQGDLTENVQTILRQENVSFIVMGTKGQSGLKHVVLGSNTFEIIQHTNIGVLTVPLGYTEYALKDIGLLCNFKTTEIELLERFVNSSSPSINLHLLHITENHQKIEEQDIQFWEDQIMKRTQVEQIQFHQMESVNRLDWKESIVDCIENIVEKQGIDLLLLAYNRKSFFKSLFSKSLPKELSRQLPIPMYIKKMDS